MIVKFETPQKLNGSEVTELNIDIESLKGSDIIEMETAFRTLYPGYIPLPDIDIRYQLMVAGRCAKVNPKDLEDLDVSAFKGVCNTVRGFLLK
jgi:hypothetical protein